MKVCVKVLEPVVKVLSYILQLDELYSDELYRFGQDLVERLVRTHTNLQFDHRLELYETGMLPWDLEMTVEESLSDDEDEDGVPHCVSDSESESENDSD
jgi:hypothetical protein